MTPAAPGKDATPVGLARDLGLWASTALVVGTMIGTGIFLKPAEVAAKVGSVEWALLAWLVGGLLSLAGALTYLELGTAMPASGADCEYLKRGLSPVFGFLYGWNGSVVKGPTSVAALALAAVAFTGFFWPSLNSQGWKLGVLRISLGQGAAVLVILVQALLNLIPVRLIGRIQVVMTSVKLLSLFGVLAAAFFLVPKSTGLVLLHSAPGPGPFLAGVGASLWAYSGWHTLLRVGGEVDRPGRTMPRAILAGFAVTALLFMLVNLACFRALPFEQVIRSRNVVSDMLSSIGGRTLAGWLTVAMIISALGTMHANLFAASRIPYALAKDKLLPRILGVVSPRTRIPVGAVVYKSLFASLLVLTGSFEELSSFYVFLQWLFFGMGGLALFRLRRLEPDLPRPVRAPGYPVVPALFVLGSVVMTLQLYFQHPLRSSIGLMLLLTGVPVFLMARRGASRPLLTGVEPS